jgi:hypothetical protein
VTEQTLLARIDRLESLDDTLRLQFTGTSHHIGNHIIEFDDADPKIRVR